MYFIFSQAGCSQFEHQSNPLLLHEQKVSHKLHGKPLIVIRSTDVEISFLMKIVLCDLYIQLESYHTMFVAFP